MEPEKVSGTWLAALTWQDEERLIAPDKLALLANFQFDFSGISGTVE